MDDVELWRYRARLDPTRTPGWVSDSGVVDGDTVDLAVDCGFYQTIRIRVRVKDIDCAEIRGVSKDSDEYELGMEQKRFVEAWMVDAAADHDGEWPLVVDTEQATGYYGRWLADIVRKSDGERLTDAVLEEWPEATY